MEIDREAFALAALLLVAAAVRAPYLLQESVWNDETVYMWLGQSIAHNPLFAFSRWPAYHSYGYTVDLLAGVFSLFTGAFTAARAAVFLISLGGVALLYFAGRELAGFWGGVAGASLMALNPLSVFFSDRALLDVPLGAALALAGYAMIKFDPKDEKSGVLLGVSGALAIFTKVTGVLAYPAVVLLAASEAYREKKVTRAVAMAAGIATAGMLLFFANNWAHFGNPLQAGGAVVTQSAFNPGANTFYFENAGFIYTWPVFVLALAGTYLSLSSRREWAVALVFWLQFLWFSFLIGEKIPRYVVQTVPLAIVLALYGAKELLDRLELEQKWAGALVAAALLAAPGIFPLIEARAVSYTGFQELGEVAAELDQQVGFSAVYAQSMRQLRTFSGLQYSGDGGKLRGLPRELDQLTNQTGILLQLDVWEYTAPDWAYPLNQEKVNGLLAENFTLVHVVQREVPTEQGTQQAPVGLLFVR